MKILIVDDEPLARARLQQLVAELQPGARLLEANDGVDALRRINEETPDIVLLDIRMPRMDGLELAGHILKLETQPAIVFTTAYQDHAISAFDANAVDYLLKPIRKERLNIALERAQLLRRSRLDAVDTDRKRSHVSAMVNGVLELIPVERIYYLKAEQKYVTAVWPNGTLLLDDPLVTLEEAFPNVFVRIHRNALVAKKHIAGIIKRRDGQSFIKLEDIPDELVISRRHLPELKALVRELSQR